MQLLLMYPSHTLQLSRCLDWEPQPRQSAEQPTPCQKRLKHEIRKDENFLAMQLNEKTGWDLGIHVDGASGGFIAPFIDQDLLWDFKLKNVHSINASGHKCALGRVLHQTWSCSPASA